PSVRDQVSASVEGSLNWSPWATMKGAPVTSTSQRRSGTKGAPPLPPAPVEDVLEAETVVDPPPPVPDEASPSEGAMMVTSLPQPSAPASAATAHHDLIGRDYAASGWILRRILAPSRTPIDGTKKNAAAS